jgi:hypothetical protein
MNASCSIAGSSQLGGTFGKMHVWPHRLPYKTAAIKHTEKYRTVQHFMCTSHGITKLKLEP